MNQNNNILLISDNKGLGLSAKIVLLRQNDNVVESTYDNAVRDFCVYTPSIVLLHENGESTIELIKELRQKKSVVGIILLVKEYNQDYILSAYDSGATDFCLVDAPDYEFVIRVVNNIRSAAIRLNNARNERLLSQFNFLDKSGFYSYKFSKEVFENAPLEEGVFMAISPSEDSKAQYSFEKMCEAIQVSVRSDDIVSLGKGVIFYIFLPKTNFEGAFKVGSKIKENYSETFVVKAGLSSVQGKNFDELEENTLKALAEAMYSDSDFIFAEEKTDTLDDWLADDNEEKNYRIFRQIFNKKLEKIIAPVFYRLQKAYEERLFNTKIEQYTDSEQCVFHLKNEKQDSKLKIVYPGFTKIVIYIKHEGFDSPENREISLSLNEITQKELVKIVEDFIMEFKVTSI